MLSPRFGLLLRNLVAIRVPLKRSKSVMRRYAKVLAAVDAGGAAHLLPTAETRKGHERRELNSEPTGRELLIGRH